MITGIGEERIILAGQLSHVDIPPTITLSGIDQLASVGANIDITLFLGCVGDTACSRVVRSRDEDIAIRYECYFLVTLSYCEVRDIVSQGLSHQLRLFVVTGDGDSYLLRSSTRRLRIDLPIVAIAEHAIGGDGEEANWIAGKGGHLLILCRSRGRRAVEDVEATTSFAQIVEATLTVPDSIAVFSAEAGELSVFAILITEPYISSDRRDSVLAPDIFVALDIGVEHLPITERRIKRGVGAIELGASHRLLQVKRIGLDEPVPGEHPILDTRDDVGLEEECVVVKEGYRELLLAIVGQAT